MAAVEQESSSSSSRRNSEENPEGEELEGEDEDKDEYEEDYDDDAEDDNDNDNDGEDAEAAHQMAIHADMYAVSLEDVGDQEPEELRLPEAIVKEVQAAWEAFLSTSTSQEAAAEALYAAVFDAAPSLQPYFKTPRAVMVMRLMNGIHQIIHSLGNPSATKVIVETFGFLHLDREVSAPRVVIFRDAILDLLVAELGSRVTTLVRDGFTAVLNYAGKNYIHIRLKYTARISILNSSWATANSRGAGESGDMPESGSGSGEEGSGDAKKVDGKKASIHRDGITESSSNKASNELSGELGIEMTRVPRNYREMFLFNAAVMGFGNRRWMIEVLQTFDEMVRNAGNSGRLQEECEVLSLRIARHKGDTVLSEYKAVMLASLRSLVPRGWNSAHESAWSWLWEMIERFLNANMGKQADRQRALSRFLGGVDEQVRVGMCSDVFAAFFTMAPAGQDAFRQSITRMHYLADRIITMTLDLYKDATKMVEEISALGLRHVGWGIPSDLFGPFVSSFVQVVRGVAPDEEAIESFTWALALISRVLGRVINEGSTIVMKAVNQNSVKQTKRAVACAPRGERASWVLNIQAGTQCISPLLWAVKSGSLAAARVIITDLLTIRADRKGYYYGMDALFDRHPDIVKVLIKDAPTLLEPLFDGLIWRSPATENGMRRVRYFVKHLILSADDQFSKTLGWIAGGGNPKIVCHPAVATVTDLVWGGVASHVVLWHKAWLLVTLAVFVAGTAVFDPVSTSSGQRWAVMVCRSVVYLLSLCPRIFWHVKQTCISYRARDTVEVIRVPLPGYLTKWQDAADLLLTFALALMLGFEPIIACVGSHDGDFEGSGLFTQACPRGLDMAFVYSAVGVAALFLYFLLTIDLSVFSMPITTYVIVALKVVGEVLMFILAMCITIFCFSCAAAILHHENSDFNTIGRAAPSFLKVGLMISEPGQFTTMADDDPALFVLVVAYILISVVFLLNLLLAQMNQSYHFIFQDTAGYARLSRLRVVTESMPSVSPSRWRRFVASLKLDEHCQFCEGDVGMKGCIQAMEPAGLHVTTVDTIRRFGGSCSPTARWPDDDNLEDEEEDRFAHLEKVVQKAMKRITTDASKNSSGAFGATVSSSKTQSNGSKGEQSGNDSEKSNGVYAM